MIALAFKYLLARPRQTFLTLLGIFFGAAAFVTLSGIMLGFREYLIDQLVNNGAHVHIQVREDFLKDHSLDQAFYQDQFQTIFWKIPPSGRKDYARIDNPQSWYRRLEADPRVAGFTPQLTASVIFSKGKATAPATIIGCDPLMQAKITTIGDYVAEGKWQDLASGGNRVIIGDDLRSKLGVRLYENVLVSLAKSAPIPFKVVAIFKTGNKMSDAQAYGAIGDVQKVNQKPNQVNEIAVRLKDFSESAAMANAWSKIAPEKIESWDQQNASIFNVFRIQDVVRYMSVGTILVVASFGIYNILNMTVVSKRRDIAILRSMGFSSSEVTFLFFFQGFVLGLVGSVSGLIFGYFVGRYLGTLTIGSGPLGGPSHLLVSVNPNIYIQAGALGIISSSIAALLPARAAGRLTPIEIIRAGAE